MKHLLLTIFLLAACLGFAQNTTLLQADFENGLPAGWSLLNADGDNYNWVDVATLTATVTNATADVVAPLIHTGANAMTSWSYYPTSITASGWNGIALNTTNYLITPQLAIPATGTAVLSYFIRSINTLYPDNVELRLSTTGTAASDFNVILTPSFTPSDLWAEQTVALESYAGQSIYIAFVHTGNDGLGVCLDDVTLQHITAPVLTATPEALSFSVNLGSVSAPATVEVAALNLTADITAAATPNFEVSGDGAAYAATATIPSHGGTLYVRYHPTTAGSHTGTVTLSSGSSSTTITLSGTAADCAGATINTFPYNENFDNGIPACWTMLDLDGDGESWISTADYHLYQHPTETSALTPHAGENAVCSRSFNNITVTPMTVNNYLITPPIFVPHFASMTFYIQAFTGYMDKYAVLLSTTGTDANDFTQTLMPLSTATREWEQKVLDLSAYTGQTVHIAFVHNHSNGFWLGLDDLSIIGIVGMDDHTQPSVSVYPNPARSSFTVANAEGEEIVILNAMGQVVSTVRGASASQTISTEGLANGIYFVRVKEQVIKVSVGR